MKEFSSLDLPATGQQKRAVARLCAMSGVHEELEQRPMTRREARDMMYELWLRRKHL